MCVLLWFHLGADAHLQGRGQGRKEQPPALLPCAALPCTALLTGLQVCQPLPWPCGAACVPKAVWKGPLQSAGLMPAPAVGPQLSKAVLNIGVGEGVLRVLPGSLEWVLSGADLSVLCAMESSGQACVLLWFHLGVVAYLQGRGQGRKQQPPALLPCAALPCTAPLTGLQVCNQQV